MKIENIKACVFDAYGTLFDVNSAAAKCKKKLGNRWESFANAWRTTQLEYTWLRSLMKKHKNFWQITEDSIDHTMETFKIKKEMKNELLNLYKDYKLKCAIGKSGIISSKKEGDLATPKGTFELGTFYYRKDNNNQLK